MPIGRLEALLDAVASVKNWSDPTSVAYCLRNPLLVKSFSKPGKSEINNEGVRIFSSSLAGIRACLFDFELKVSGESRAWTKKNSKQEILLLENLLRVYDVPPGDMPKVVMFLKKALQTGDISLSTPLTYFSE